MDRIVLLITVQLSDKFILLKFLDRIANFLDRYAIFIYFFYIGISGSKHASKYCIASWASFKGQNSHPKAFTDYEVECYQTGKCRVLQIIAPVWCLCYYLITFLTTYFVKQDGCVVKNCMPIFWWAENIENLDNIQLRPSENSP